MRRAVAELERLDDDVLRDIGITRAQIPSLALRMTAPPATATTSIAAQSGIERRSPYDYLAKLAR
jgi:hypothetical protein